MKNDDIKIAIALCVGWKPETRRKYAGLPNVKGWGFNTHLGLGAADRQFITHPGLLPEYTSDLNACAEFENTIKHDDWPRYAKMLCSLAIGQPVVTDKLNMHEAFMAATAKPELRCEAFVRLFGKWKEMVG